MGCHVITMGHHGLGRVCHGNSMAAHGITMDCRGNVMRMSRHRGGLPWYYHGLSWKWHDMLWRTHGNGVACDGSVMDCHGNANVAHDDTLQHIMALFSPASKGYGTVTTISWNYTMTVPWHYVISTGLPMAMLWANTMS